MTREIHKMTWEIHIKMVIKHQIPQRTSAKAGPLVAALIGEIKNLVAALGAANGYEIGIYLAWSTVTVCYGKSPFLMGKSTINGPFSIAIYFSRG